MYKKAPKILAGLNCNHPQKNRIDGKKMPGADRNRPGLTGLSGFIIFYFTSAMPSGSCSLKLRAFSMVTAAIACSASLVKKAW